MAFICPSDEIGGQMLMPNPMSRSTEGSHNEGGVFFGLSGQLCRVLRATHCSLSACPRGLQNVGNPIGCQAMSINTATLPTAVMGIMVQQS